jgi:hypothetical protein
LSNVPEAVLVALSDAASYENRRAAAGFERSDVFPGWRKFGTRSEMAFRRTRRGRRTHNPRFPPEREARNPPADRRHARCNAMKTALAGPELRLQAREEPIHHHLRDAADQTLSDACDRTAGVDGPAHVVRR